MLVFIAVAQNTPIMPMACELETGRTKLLYEEYTHRAFEDPATAPKYPSDHLSTQETRAIYWKALTEAFSSGAAMETVESSGIPKEKSRSDSPGLISEYRSALAKLYIFTACQTADSTPACSDTTSSVAGSGKGSVS